MSERNPIRLYAVHGWHRDEDYARLFEYIESAENFFYKVISDPGTTPPGGDGSAARRSHIVDSLKDVECVVCPAGTWERFNEWARFTVERAKERDLPVVALEHFGPRNMDLRLKGHADEIVGWDSRSIVDAIRRQARHEDTARFDTIEFEP